MSDYILVKDQEGKLKYFKDGQYFEVAEIDNAVSQNNGAPVVQKGSGAPLKPVMNFNLQDEDDDLPENDLGEVKAEVDRKVNEAVEAIIAELKISFTDDAIRKKFFNILVSKLREVRGDKEVRYMLSVPKDEGGLGLDIAKIDLILKVAAKHESGLHEVKKTVAEKLPMIPVKSMVLDKAPVLRKPEVLAPATQAPAPKPLPPVTPAKPIIKPEIKAEIKPGVAEPKPAIQALDKLIRSESGKGGYDPFRDLVKVKEPAPLPEKKVELRSSSRLMGPIEELRTLRVVDFRRLGSTPVAIIEKLREKLETLKVESWKKWVDAILAWQESPVFLLYTAMGVDSLMTGKPISEVVVARQVKNEDSLTPSEFNAILEFNKGLDL